MRAYARLDSDSPPGWVGRIIYAETFGVEPHLVNPPLRWWLRWQAWLEARFARQACEHKARSTDWVKDLSKAEKAAVMWAEREYDDE